MSEHQITLIIERLAKIETNSEWIRSELNKSTTRFAPFWIKYPVYLMCTGALSWTGYQLVQFIEAAKALFF
jgi:hypothetical protein